MHFSRQRLSRRAFLGTAGAMAAVAAAGCAGSGRGKPAARLRVMMNGVYEEHARRLVIDPLERDTGAMIIGRG